MSGLRWFSAALLLLAGPVAAQTYKCTGPDGKTTFSDRPCPGQKSVQRRDPPNVVVSPGGQAPSANPAAPAALTPEARAAAARRWNITEEAVQKFERDCAGGNDWRACLTLQELTSSSPAQTFRELEARDRDNKLKARVACARGDKEGCERLEWRRQQVESLEHECARGNKHACDALPRVR